MTKATNSETQWLATGVPEAAVRRRFAGRELVGLPGARTGWRGAQCCARETCFAGQDSLFRGLTSLLTCDFTIAHNNKNAATA